MDSKNCDEDCIKNQMPKADIKNGSNPRGSSQLEAKSSSGPTVLFFWVWNWFATLPKIITNLYTDLKSGELLARFTLLDAMLQFIVAVATSCHPQEESEADDHKANGDPSLSSKSKNDVKTFGGTGRTLRSRTLETNS